MIEGNIKTTWGKRKEAHPNNYRVMVSLQRGARYGLEERLVRKALIRLEGGQVDCV
jgi:hypothetical protein